MHHLRSVIKVSRNQFRPNSTKRRVHPRRSRPTMVETKGAPMFHPIEIDTWPRADVPLLPHHGANGLFAHGRGRRDRAGARGEGARPEVLSLLFWVLAQRIAKAPEGVIPHRSDAFAICILLRKCFMHSGISVDTRTSVCYDGIQEDGLPVLRSAAARFWQATHNPSVNFLAFEGIEFHVDSAVDNMRYNSYY